jgi:hypothetical protein
MMDHESRQAWESDPDRRIAGDFEALRRATDREVPSLERTVQELRRRGVTTSPGLWGIGRKLMAAMDSVQRKPGMMAALAGVAIVLVAMVVPVSYQRVTGQDVTVTLSGATLGPQEIGPIAKDLKSRLGAKSVLVNAEAGPQGAAWVFQATSANRSRKAAGRTAGAFVKEMAERGYAASLQVSPHTERVKYPVAAYAWDQLIQISVDGKSAAQLQSEIRQRLAEAGVSNAQVSVTDRPEGGREVTMKVERENAGDGAAALEPVPQLQLTKNGVPLSGGSTVKVQKKKSDSGALTVVVEVASGGKTATATVANAESMSDAALESAINAQLAQAGMTARVKVLNGAITLESTE